MLPTCWNRGPLSSIWQRSMDRPRQLPNRAAHADLPLPAQVALVLQGGGALGAFQAGVVESLFELGIPVTWVAGISIGAVNAAIIAGNPPDSVVERLREFWDLAVSGMPWFLVPDGGFVRESAHLAAAAWVMSFGVPGFFRPHIVPPWLQPDGTTNATSFYDTSPLVETLDRLVDWDRLNHGPVRFSVGAVDVESGNFDYFCNHNPRWRGRIDARHVMASGALPPGLPGIEIDGRLYWDGGMVSNTPLQHILDHQREDTLIFQCDLFPAEGPRPRTMSDVLSRQKDIQYSSRTRQVTDQYLRLRREHHLVARLLDSLPEDVAGSPEALALRETIDVGAVNIVHLIYRSRAWESGARDFEFSRPTMLDHWAQGRTALADVIRKGDRLLARNIVNGKSASFDLQQSGEIKEKTT